jgi:hypothetical protein
MQNMDDVNAIGRTALDEGVVGGMPTNARGLAQRAEKAAGNAGSDLGVLTDELASNEASSAVPPTHRKGVADSLRKRLLVQSDVPAIQKRNQFYGDMIDDFERTGSPQMKFGDVRQTKMDVGGTKEQEGLIKWNRLPTDTVPPEEQFHRALYTELKNAENQGAGAIDKAVNGESSSRFQDAKERFGNLDTARKIAENRAASQEANHFLGLKDTIHSAVGASIGAGLGYQVDGEHGAKVGAGLGGAIGGLGSKLVHTYGNQVTATAANNFSKFLANSPVLADAVRKNPAIAPMLMKSLGLDGDGSRSSGPAVTPKLMEQIQKKSIAHRFHQRRTTEGGAQQANAARAIGSIQGPDDSPRRCKSSGA